MPEQFTHRAICQLRERGQVIRDYFVSQVLASNPLGDPAERDLLVYLPPGYERSGGRRYPVVFASLRLFGERRLAVELAALSAHALRPPRTAHGPGLARTSLIVIMPDCFTTYRGSQYLNSPAIGNYDDYLVQKLVPYIDRTYRTLEDGRRGNLRVVLSLA